MHRRFRDIAIVLFAGTALVLSVSDTSLAQKRALTFVDLMKFRQVRQPAISDEGDWIAFHAVPDRGDGAVVVRSVSSEVRYEIPRGSRPIISHNGKWVAMKLDPPFAETENASKDEKPEPGLALLELESGSIMEFSEVDSFAVSADGRWLARLGFRAKDEADSTSTESKADDKTKREFGALLVLQELGSSVVAEIEDVRHFAFDEEGAVVAYAVASPDSLRDGLYLRDLNADPFAETSLDVRPRGDYTSLTWSKDADWLAFLATQDDSSGKPAAAGVYWWNGSSVQEIVPPSSAPEGWMIPLKNTVRWSKDRERLFFGYRPEPDVAPKSAEDSTGPADPFDTEAILAKREVDVWHWDDPRIIPQQKKVWKKEQERTYAAVYDLSSATATALSDLDVMGVGKPENALTMLGKAAAPYFKEVTWDGDFFDLYTIDMTSGDKMRVAKRLQHATALSPGGRFVVYYRSPDWYVYSVESGDTRNVTEGVDVPFSNEDHDYPSDPPDYGIGGWVGEDEAVLINDKYDVWYVPLSGAEQAVDLTGGAGRLEGRTFRVIRTDPDRQFYEPKEQLLLSSYDNNRKNWGFYRARLGTQGVQRLLEEDKQFRFVVKAKDADRYVFTREDYDEFPDLWVSGPEFRGPRKLTELNPQIKDFAWGSAELVAWSSDDGIPLQGVLIRPGNYEPGKRYPVIVYFYRFMSQLLHVFNEPVVNHRPSFPLYASNGYAVFLPDIRFEIGRPGFSATKAIVPGVQKLVEMGVADPKAIGLHGHSWSGYQTAFIVTQTDIFAAAVAGAPVSNMTSAYDGIRWESGLARQFQYEKTQSRLGGSLWEARDRYIDNSPVFFADRVHTPLLLMFGDEDGAVPWYQGIELYLALRRNGKDAIFLQYRGEPHHLKKYPNKLDYSIKMKEYFDHYLKGAPAPAWITTGVPYSGD
jgi:dipeptidyl aminopeptidase/acylaminoacyl peptidase